MPTLLWGRWGFELESAYIIHGSFGKMVLLQKWHSYVQNTSCSTWWRKPQRFCWEACKSTAVGMSHLHAFWKNYQKMHPTHILFGEACPGRSWSNTFCLALHGDEGRGLKKGNTCVVMMESCLGLDTSIECDPLLHYMWGGHSICTKNPWFG